MLTRRGGEGRTRENAVPMNSWGWQRGRMPSTSSRAATQRLHPVGQVDEVAGVGKVFDHAAVEEGIAVALAAAKRGPVAPRGGEHECGWARPASAGNTPEKQAETITAVGLDPQAWAIIAASTRGGTIRRRPARPPAIRGR